MQVFGERLKKWRKKSGISAEVLAYKIDTDVSTYYRYEHGIISPTIDVLVQLCDLLSCTPNDLCNYENEPSELSQFSLKSIKSARVISQMPDVLQEITLLVVNGIRIQGDVFDVGRYLDTMNNLKRFPNSE